MHNMLFSSEVDDKNINIYSVGMHVSKIVLDIFICLIFIGIWTGTDKTYGEPLFTYIHLIFHLQFIQYTFVTTERFSLNILVYIF